MGGRLRLARPPSRLRLGCASCHVLLRNAHRCLANIFVFGSLRDLAVLGSGVRDPSAPPTLEIHGRGAGGASGGPPASLSFESLFPQGRLAPPPCVLPVPQQPVPPESAAAHLGGHRRSS